MFQEKLYTSGFTTLNILLTRNYVSISTIVDQFYMKSK